MPTFCNFGRIRSVGFVVSFPIECSMKGRSMKNENEIKSEVKQKYSEIARGRVDVIATPASSCCSGNHAVVNMSVRYDDADRGAAQDSIPLLSMGLSSRESMKHAGAIFNMNFKTLD